MTECRPFSDTEMKVYKDLFMDYCVLGGMPAVVSQYIRTGHFSKTLEIQRQINIDYEEDLRANKNLGIYKGALFENFIAEAFVKQGFGLYYYKKSFRCAKI